MSAKTLPSGLSNLLFNRSGELTRNLLRQPGKFGLGQVPERLSPDSTTTLTCGYCSTGCGLDLHLKGGEAVNLSPSTNYPVNLGMACPKGWEALTPLKSSDRATQPLLREERGGALRPVDWETAIQTFVERMRGVQERQGAESTAFISTGQITMEEMALLGAFAKFGMGMVHGDGNTRQCMATAVVAYKQAFGFDAPPYTYADFEASDVLVFVGANPCIAHPIMWERVCRNPNQPQIIVLDPRRTETATAATQHLALQPKSDLTLLYAIAKYLIDHEFIDRDFIQRSVEGFDAFSKHVQDFTIARAATETGLSAASIETAAKTIGEGRAVSFWWTMGVNQSHQGVRLAQSIINLALITGNIGRPGTGANSITGQCNAMGSRLYSNTTGLFAGRNFENDAHREDIASILGIDADLIPSKNSWSYDRIMEGVHQGSIKALWIVATNTAHSWINQNDVKELLGKLDFLVVQDMYPTTETAQLADLVLPAAGWGEKEGVFINSERRLGLTKRVRRAPGEALADFAIFKLLSEAWGSGEMLREWESPEAVFQILKRCSKGTPCDITGIADYAMLDRARGIQWPFPAGSQLEGASERRLFEDGRFYREGEKALLLFEAPQEPPETPDRRYPMALLTGRGSASQWHTNTRTGKSPVLRKLYSQDPYVELNPKDARGLGVEPNAWVTVESRRGRATARAFVTSIVSPGQCFMPMHYAQTNRLTFPAFDPHSRQPSYKMCAVRVRPAGELPPAD